MIDTLLFAPEELCEVATLHTAYICSVSPDFSGIKSSPLSIYDIEAPLPTARSKFLYREPFLYTANVIDCAVVSVTAAVKIPALIL
mgnify:CR=1 FL=1